MAVVLHAEGIRRPCGKVSVILCFGIHQSNKYSKDMFREVYLNLGVFVVSFVTCPNM